MAKNNLTARKGRKVKQMKKKQIIKDIVHDAIMVLVIAATISAWLYIMYECLLGGWE